VYLVGRYTGVDTTLKSREAQNSVNVNKQRHPAAHNGEDGVSRSGPKVKQVPRASG
jgi:hypothetical protein